MRPGLAVPLVFFISGASGLILEIVWFERCGLVFGNSVVTTSLVLSSFMAGLASGNALVGWFGPRIRRPLRCYAALEAIVAVSGIAVTYWVGELTGIVTTLTRLFSDAPWLVNLMRLGAGFLVLAIPTAAMGATLPALVMVRAPDQPAFGQALGRLYGWNTLGAVTGVLAAEFVLIRAFGITGSAWVATLLSLAAAAAAWWLSRLESAAVVETAAPAKADRDRAAWRLLACAFLAGADLLALEVIWLRFLSLFVVSSTMAVSLVLAVVLTGIGLGGLAASAFLRRRPGGFGLLPIAAFIAACISATSYGAFRIVAGGPWAAEWNRVLWFACALTLPTAVLSGIIFTFIGAALRRHVAGDARAAAWMTLANTTGGMAGPPIAAFVMLPALGMEGSFFALAVVYAAVGLLAVRDLVPDLRTAVGRACLAGGLATLIALAMFPFGSMTTNYLPRAVRLYASDGSGIVATREGPSETVVLMQKSWMERPLFHRLVTNSFSMSGTQVAGKRYMRYFAYWPMFLHRAALRQALVICYGVGVTAGAVTDIKSIASIDVVETSREVVAMSDVIYPADERPLSDRRVRLHIEDGRNFLQTTVNRYDLITGEPPPPLTPGTVNLFTREYFQLAHDRLAEGGMLTYWLPVARRGEYDVKAIIGAFCDVFADCSLWNGTPLDWVLIGTRDAEPAVAAQFVQPWADPPTAAHLREIGFERAEQVGATFLGDAGYLKGLTRNTQSLTDNYPQRLHPLPERLSLLAPPDAVDVDFIRQVVDPMRAREAFRQSEFVHRVWPGALLTETLPFFEQQRVVNRLLLDGANPLRYIEELHALVTGTSLQTPIMWALGSDDVQQDIAHAVDDGSYMVAYTRGVRAFAARDFSRAAELFADAEQRGLRTATVRPLLVYALCLAGELDLAGQLSQGDMPTDPDRQHFWSWLGSKFAVGPGRRDSH